MTYYFLYVILIPTLILFSFVLGNKKFNHVPIILLLLLTLFRYDNTTDYSAYVTAFWDIRNNNYNGWFEPGYVFLNSLFSFTKWGFIPVLMISSIIPYTQIYKVLKREKILLVGFFLFVTLGYFIRFENIIRQGIAIGIFYYSLNYFFQKKLSYVLLLNLIAISIHSSAIFCITIYFLIWYLNNRKISIVLTGIIILVLLLNYIFFGRGIVLNFLISFSPLLNNYLSELVASDFDNFIGLSLTVRLLIYWLPSYFLRNNSHNSFIELSIKLSAISAILELVFLEFIVLGRLAEYFILFRIVAIAYLIKYFINYKKKFVFPVLIVIFLLINHHRNVSTYYLNYKFKTVFSEYCQDHYLYVRTNRWQVKDFNNEDNNNRKILRKYNPK